MAAVDEAVFAALRTFGFKPNGNEGRFIGRCPFCTSAGFIWNRSMRVFTCEHCDVKGIPGDGSGTTEELYGRLRKRVGIRVAEVQTEKVSWLWERRIPFAKITCIDGDPGLGKSLLTLAITAAVTTATGLPDGGSIEAGTVLLLNAEDGIGDTIRPRLEAAGADLDRVVVLGHQGRGFLFPRDFPSVETAIALHGPKLLVIDPIMAHLEGDVNSHRDQDVRSLVMAPLARMAEKTGAAIVVVRHLNKGTTGNPLYRGGGSIGFAGASRSNLVVAKDPDDEERRVLAGLKVNLSPKPRSLSFRLIEDANGIPMVQWLGGSGYDASALLQHADSPESDRDRSAVGEAAEWLKGTLANGAVESNELKRLAGAANIPERTLWRAKEKLDVRARKSRITGIWSWELREECQPLS
jgi:hypothetical protein